NKSVCIIMNIQKRTGRTLFWPRAARQVGDKKVSDQNRMSAESSNGAPWRLRSAASAIDVPLTDGAFSDGLLTRIVSTILPRNSVFAGQSPIFAPTQVLLSSPSIVLSATKFVLFATRLLGTSLNATTGLVSATPLSLTNLPGVTDLMVSAISFVTSATLKNLDSNFGK